MPVYEYDCPKCKVRFTKMAPLTMRDVVFECPNCNTSVKRAISMPARVWAPTRTQ